MNRHTITYENKNSFSDYGLTVGSVNVGPPVIRKNEVTIPYRSSVIDMDEVIGYPTYDDRTITVKMWKKLTSVEEVNKCQQELITWFLSDTTKSKLEDSADKYYYNAYCSQLDFSESTAKVMMCTATFKAYPFKIAQNGEECI